MRQFITALALFLLVAFGLIAWQVLKGIPAPEPTVVITNFEECAAAGYPIMESFPEQCRTPDGKTFVRDIDTPIAAPQPLPTAGVCAPAGESVHTLRVRGDIPDPRCQKYASGERLRIENLTEETLLISLAAGKHRYGFSVEIPPGESYEHPYPLDSFLGTGVHRLEGPAYAGGELWVNPSE